MIAELGAVLDACVLFSAPLRDTLLRAAAADLYFPLWTQEILEEMRRNLVADARVPSDRAARLVAVMQEAFSGTGSGGLQHIAAPAKAGSAVVHFCRAKVAHF